MKRLLDSIVTLCLLCLLLIPVAAEAATQTSSPSSTLVLQCGAAERDASASATTSPVTASSTVVPSVAVPVTPVPEPSTWLLLGAGLVGLLRVARRKHDSP